METENHSARINCIFTGDVMPGARRVIEAANPVLQEELRAANMVVGNLEYPVIAERPQRINTAKIPLWSDAANVELLKDHGFTHLGLNNNHIYDLFEKGLDDTVAIIDQAGIKTYGINYKGVSQFNRVTINGITLGMVAVNWIETNFSRNLCKDYRSLDLASLKKQCDFLVMSVHWGDDHNIFINADQKDTARLFIDSGVDLIIGHHPHVPQGYEIYKGRYIFYSLGNFIFTPREEYDFLPYEIRYEDGRENLLFQRPECKIGLYVRVVFDSTRYSVVAIRPVYRADTLPAMLPGRLQSFFDSMMEHMNEQVRQSICERNEAEKRTIFAQYTMPFILKHPVYWPIFFRKASIKKLSRFISQGRIFRRWIKSS